MAAFELYTPQGAEMVSGIIIIIITFLFTQGMPKQLKTGFHWGPACVNIKIEYREYGNPRQNNNYMPHHKLNLNRTSIKTNNYKQCKILTYKFRH